MDHVEREYQIGRLTLYYSVNVSDKLKKAQKAYRTPNIEDQERKFP